MKSWPFPVVVCSELIEGLLEMRILFVGLCSPLSVEIIDL